MEFANPLFLFGLAALAIPIIIHLFNFRRFKKVFFTNVRFIQELKQQTRQQSQLRHLLVLLMRLLAITALVLAFARPYIPLADIASNRQATNAISVYVDNSFSMEAESGEGRVLDQALNMARETAMAYASSDRFQLLTNDFEARHQRFVNRDDFIDLLSEVELTPTTRKISQVYKRQLEMLGKAKGSSRNAFIISDFQKTTTDFGNIQADTSVRVFVVPATSLDASNLYIDSLWFVEPVYRVDQLATVYASLVNASDQDVEKIPVRLMIKGSQRALASVDIHAGERIEISLPWSNTNAGPHYGELALNDYPITYDDNFYFAYNVLNEIPVFAINGGEESVYLQSLFGKDSLFLFRQANENSLDYTTFNRYNLIILDDLNSISSGLSQELKRFVAGGGNVAVFPGEDIDQASYREFFLLVEMPYTMVKDTFETRVNKINVESILYDDVFESLPENIDLPVVFQHYSIRQQTQSMMEVLLEMQDGDIFLGSEPVLNGMVYLFATPLDKQWTNFPKHAIFVPTLYKMALLSKPATKLYYTAGREQTIDLRNTGTTGDKIFKIASMDKTFEIIPESRSLGTQVNIFTGNQITTAGVYQLNSDGDYLESLAFNYDRRESDLEKYTAAMLTTQIADYQLQNFVLPELAPGQSLTAGIANINSGKKLWKLFIIAALAFLLAEVVLLRLWK